MRQEIHGCTDVSPSQWGIIFSHNLSDFYPIPTASMDSVHREPPGSGSDPWQLFDALRVKTEGLIRVESEASRLSQ